MNEARRNALSGVWTEEQLYFYLFSLGYSLTEPGFKPEVPIRPLRPDKLRGMRPKEAKIIRRKYHERLAQKGNIFHR